MSDELIPFCAHADTTLDARDTRWSSAAVARGLAWTLQGDLPGLAHAAFLDTLRRAFTRISSVCGLTFREASGDANIIVTTGPIDGASGILAQSALPPADPCEQRYDSAEQWNKTINLLPVVLHELGHALGLQHDPQPGALLSAYYSPSIQDYTSRDIQRLQALYGPPVVKPPDPPGIPGDPSPQDGSFITVQIEDAKSITFYDSKGRRGVMTFPG